MTERWQASPVLGVPNVRAAVDFFCDKLGFERPQMLHGPKDAEVYALVRRGGIAIHLQLRAGDAFPSPRGNEDGDAYLTVENAEALHAEYTAKGVRVQRALKAHPYGLRDFAIETPDGHRLSFGSEI